MAALRFIPEEHQKLYLSMNDRRCLSWSINPCHLNMSQLKKDMVEPYACTAQKKTFSI